MSTFLFYLTIFFQLKATFFYYPVGPQKTFEIFGSKIGLRKEMLSFKSEISIFVLYLSIYLNIFSLLEEKPIFNGKNFKSFLWANRIVE